ncbi:MAG: sensor histidine kinase, partial [Rhodospirillales bacterium]
SEIIKSEIMGPVGTPRYLEYAEDIHSSGSHLLSLINDLLDLSRIEAGKFVLHPEAIDIEACVQDCLNLLLPKADQCGIRLNSSLASDMPRLNGDERRFKQILLNLIGNALKFTPRGGSVTLSGSFDTASGFRLQVIDTGSGIPKEDQERVLQPFDQARGDIFTRNDEGVGLGLPLTKGLVELHDGSMELASQLGIGTTVTLRFPAKRAISSPDNPV